MTASEFRKLIEEKGKIEAVRVFVSVEDEKSADAFIFQYVMKLLANGHYGAAAVLLWGNDVFDARPESVRRIWRGIGSTAKRMIMGCASAGKSYTVIVWLLLDWWRDPAWTSVKIVSTTASHAMTNTFATLVHLHRTAIIPMPGVITEGCICVNGDKRAAIIQVSVPSGSDGKGRLQGFHPIKRATPHPIFGNLSRIRAFLDEAEEIAIGVWEGVGNAKKNLHGAEIIKIICAFNPKDVSTKVAQFSCPDGGYDAHDPDVLKEWVSKEGWDVTRIDGRDLENVRERRVVYEGLQTYEGYREGELENGGNSPQYWCVDRETRVLSKLGWVNFNSLSIGDEIFTVNMDGFSEWAPVLDIFRANFEGELVSMEGRGFSALVTENHKWPVTSKLRLKTKLPMRLKLKETKDLKEHDLIPLNRPPIARDESVFTDGFAALMGWVISDGTYGYWNRVDIGQSIIANPEKCEEIRSVLSEVDAKWTEKLNNGILHFGFSGTLGIKVKENAPMKKLKMEFIEALSDSGRRRLLDALISGDGWRTECGQVTICTADEQQAGVYSALMSIMGIPNTTHRRWVPESKPLKNGWTPPGKWMFQVCIRRSKHTRRTNMRITMVPHNDIVWCPSTKNGTFLARRNGTVYFTGNTMCRGWYPPDGVSNNIISSQHLSGCRGEFIFTGSVVKCAGVDIAVDGRDRAVMTTGRYGLARAFIHYRMIETGGQKVIHRQEIAFPENRNVLQIDQQFELRKGSTSIVAHEIRDKCKEMGVAPEWCCVDRTGNGATIHDLLCEPEVWGPGVQGCDFSKGATEIKILREDKETPEEMYSGVVTEVWFALRKWMEFGYLALSPSLRADPLNQELLGRKYLCGEGKKLRVEKKDDYVGRLGASPDFADSLSLICHGVRMRSGVVSSMTGKRAPERDYSVTHGVIDTAQGAYMSEESV